MQVLNFILFILPVSGHTLMQNPIPFSSQLLDNGPMAKDGSDWPCKGEKRFNPNGVMNMWERGSTQHLQAMGGASHGGGSCQISVTRDLKPTVFSEWRVIHSVHGGCPIRNLTEVNYGDSASTLLPSIYNFTIPDWLPVGQAVMAWTWYGRWSVPEVFMNCAPIMVLGGHTDKDVTDAAWDEKFKSAPLMFEANNGNGCVTAKTGSCVVFPEPGDSVEVNSECPFDAGNMFTGICGPSQRLALLSSRWDLGSYWLTVGLVAVVSVFLIISLAKVFQTRRAGENKYDKVLQAYQFEQENYG
ncbi:lytic polysaccharide monooxygenase [Cadophora sp. DSE1049]|nr:lytic polysaccharide monooxygenase [Cadophora sp. DSE1049]